MRLIDTNPLNCIQDVESLQKSVVSHVINTLARTHFNCDDFAGYQAAAHR